MKKIYSACQSVLIWLSYLKDDRHDNGVTSQPHEWQIAFTHEGNTVTPDKSNERTINEFVGHLKAFSLFINKYLGGVLLAELASAEKACQRV
jgi:hypothetical protein